MQKFIGKSRILVGILVLLIACLGVFAGCDSKKSIEISVPSGDYQVVPSESITFKAELKGVKAEDVTFAITDGSEYAVITNDGKLTANNDATVGEVIKVIAESKDDKVKSNEITITICNKLTTSLSLTADRYSLTAENKSVQINPVFDLYVSNKTVTYEIVGDCDFATVDENGKVSLVADTTKYPTDKTVFKVKATYTANTEISAEIELTFLLPLESLKMISVDDCIINADNTTSQYVSIMGKSVDNDILDSIDQAYFNFTSDNSVASVASDGKITIKGHGKQEVTVTLAGSSDISATFNIYVFATPSTIAFDTTKVSTQIANKNIIYFGKNDGLKLDEMLAFSKKNNLNVTTAFKVYVDNVEQTYTDDGLKFAETGTKTVKVVSDPAIAGFSGTMPKIDEVAFEFTAYVNDGVNIATVQEFKNYSTQADNTVANILADLKLTETDNFGGNGTDGYLGLDFKGDRYINGNGYTLNAENLPVAKAGIASLLEFSQASDTATEPFTVQIRDFSLIGQATIAGTHVKSGESFINAEMKSFGIYRRGIRINEKREEYTQRNYIKDFLLENVTIQQFYTALRVSHAVDGKMDNVYIDKCYANGFEMEQNIMTINDIHIGKVGAFGIEITPDDMNTSDPANPQGTSGKEFNQAQSITLTGTITSENYNTTTPYLSGLDSKVSNMSNGAATSIASLIGRISGGTVQVIATQLNATQEQTAGLETFLAKLMKNGEGQMNNFMLLFVNPSDFPSYTKGNTENKFAKYPEINDMANITDVLVAYAQNPDTYTAYKGYQYLLMDLAAEGMNIGQIVLVNQAYDSTYVPTTE